MLGHDIVEALDGRDVSAPDRAALDITDERAVRDAVAAHDVVINCAAYTDVDRAEAEPERALAINGAGVGVLAEASAAVGARFVHVSTDYVFDGRGSEPYSEDAPLNPVNAYGRSKADGERRAAAAGPHLLVRTAWLYGAHGSNFAATMHRLSRERSSVEVVDDQIGQPTWTRDLAHRIVEMLDAHCPPGIYHATNGGTATWFEFARAVFSELGLDPDRVRPISSSAFPRPAARPAFSVLGHDAWARVGLPALRPWRAALSDAVAAGVLAA